MGGFRHIAERAHADATLHIGQEARLRALARLGGCSRCRWCCGGPAGAGAQWRRRRCCGRVLPAAAPSVPADSDVSRKVGIGAAGAGSSAVVAMPRAHKK